VDESRRSDVTGAAGTDDAERAGPASPGDAEVDRLRSRAGRTAATAYTATYGHPTSHAGFAGLGEEGRRRWALRPRTAVVALVVVLLLAAGVVLLRSPAGGVTPVAALDATPIGGPATDPEAESVALAGAGATTDGGAAEPAATGGEGVGTEGAPSGGVVVHVVGQVATPGLVTVAADARVADALEAAGGATAEADLAALNLARTVTDGEQIVVPRPGEAVPAAGSAAPAAGTPAGGAVDLNAADAAALDGLPGIGPVLAERIVAWREENGPFTTVDELGEVSGIGPAVLADVRDLVRV
jgi:competence protein ComEA